MLFNCGLACGANLIRLPLWTRLTKKNMDAKILIDVCHGLIGALLLAPWLTVAIITVRGLLKKEEDLCAPIRDPRD